MGEGNITYLPTALTEEALANQLETDFPDCSRSQMLKLVERHLFDLELFEYDLTLPANVDRAIVNMLRHEYTNYDYIGQTQEAHREACDLIGDRYPWLRGECRRQVAQRAGNESIEAGMLAAYLAEEEAAKARRRAMSDASKIAIGELSAGDQVTITFKGREYSGPITWVGRTKVEVSYRIKSGAERTRRVYASEVRLVQADVLHP